MWSKEWLMRNWYMRINISSNRWPRRTPRNTLAFCIWEVRVVMDVLQVSKLTEYFHNKRDVPLYNNTYWVDNNYTPIYQANTNWLNIRHPTVSTVSGRDSHNYPGQDNRHEELRKAHRLSHIDDRCLLCGNSNEIIGDIINGYRMLTQREYIRRYNDVCRIINKQVVFDLELLHNWRPYSRHVPIPVLENEYYLLFWERTIQTSHVVVHNQTDRTNVLSMSKS